MEDHSQVEGEDERKDPGKGERLGITGVVHDCFDMFCRGKGKKKKKGWVRCVVCSVQDGSAMRMKQDTMWSHRVLMLHSEV